MATSNGLPGLDDVIVAAMFNRLEVIEFEALDTAEDLAGLEADAERAEAKYDEVLADTELEDQIGRRAFRARLAAFEAVRATRSRRYSMRRDGERVARAPMVVPVRELREEWPD